MKNQGQIYRGQLMQYGDAALLPVEIVAQQLKLFWETGHSQARHNISLRILSYILKLIFRQDGPNNI